MKKPSCPPRGRDIAGHVGKIKTPGLLRARHTGLGPTALGPSATELWVKTATSIFCATALLTGRNSGWFPLFQEASPDSVFIWPSSEAWQRHHQHAGLNINCPASSPAAAPGPCGHYSVAQSCLTLPSWRAARQAPPSMGFPQEYCSGLPFPSPADLPDPGIEPRLRHRQAGSLTLRDLGTSGRLQTLQKRHDLAGCSAPGLETGPCSIDSGYYPSPESSPQCTLRGISGGLKPRGFVKELLPRGVTTHRHRHPEASRSGLCEDAGLGGRGRRGPVQPRGLLPPARRGREAYRLPSPALDPSLGRGLEEAPTTVPSGSSLTDGTCWAPECHAVGDQG